MLWAMPAIPSGTVTFVFTDIEGSTRLLKELGDRYGDLLATHRRLIRDVFSRYGGEEIDTQGDAFFYSFGRAREAVKAAIEAQRKTAQQEWPGGARLKIRMGLHTGEPAVGEEGYLGLDVVRAARLASAGHGGQILVSETTRALIGVDLPDGVHVRDLGETQLKDLDRPELVYELVIDGVTEEHPPLVRPERQRRDELRERTRAAIEARVLSEIAGGRPKASGREAPGEVLKWAVVGLVVLLLTLATFAAVAWIIVRLIFG
jgi:class 3 adenylate cyclase